MDERKPFGEYLRDLRIRYGFSTQKQLADASGVSQTTLSRIEAGTQKPQPETLKLLAQQLRPITYGELMERAGYFDGLSNDDKNLVTEFFDDHDELDEILERTIRSLTTADAFSEETQDYVRQELGPLFESEGIEFENTPKDLRQLLRELDADLDFKSEIYNALMRVKKLRSSFYRSAEHEVSQGHELKPVDEFLLDDDVKAVARDYVELESDQKELFKAMLKTMRERGKEARKDK